MSGCGFAFGILVGVALLVVWSTHCLFSVPAHLRHLPVVPLIPLLRSYASREADDVRIRRLILPFANKESNGVVLVWAMGIWMVHVIDPKLYTQVASKDGTLTKVAPAKGSMFWRFVGDSNVAMVHGAKWKKQSRILRQALTLPIDTFVSLAKNVFEVIEATGTDLDTHTVSWSDLAQRFTLDAVGASTIGHNFDAIRTESPFVRDYNAFMRDVASPLYLVFPSLEQLWPRTKLASLMENLISGFEQALREKVENPGDDIMTYMVRHSEMSAKELRDNMATLFLAGHDTTSAAISSLIYFLAVNQSVQNRVRAEVISVLGPDTEPSLSTLSPQSLPYLHASIREVLRINPPASYVSPRISPLGINLGNYYIPPQTPTIFNIYAVHHNDAIWGDPGVFRPERFLDEQSVHSKATLIPFSSGPRQCPAQNFALYEMRTMAVMLVREYEWVLPEPSIHADGIKNAFSPFALTLPCDLDITFRRRSRASS